MSDTQKLLDRKSAIASMERVMEAMRLMSVTKVRRWEDADATCQTVIQEVCGLLQPIAAAPHVLPMPSFLRTPKGKKRPALWLVLGSDKGLCGSFHYQLVKQVQQSLAKISHTNSYAQPYVLAYGARTGRMLNSLGLKELDRRAWGKQTHAAVTQEIMAFIEQHMKSGRFSSIVLFTTRFRHALQQDVEVKDFVDLLTSLWVGKKGRKGLKKKTQPSLHVEEEQEVRDHFTHAQVMVEPSALAFLEGVMRFYSHSMIYQACVESALCEERMRMTAMDAAVRNSKDLLEDINLVYNRKRQQAITKELIEVVSGAEAL